MVNRMEKNAYSGEVVGDPPESSYIVINPLTKLHNILENDLSILQTSR